MSSLAAIREKRRVARIAQLREGVTALLSHHSSGEVWLFGSLARGDWDAYSDVDLLAIAPTQAAAEDLADALVEAGLGDDVLALSQTRWQQLKGSDNPYWRAIARDARCLDRP
jgi:predicted nucleotidyltransferase